MGTPTLPNASVLNNPWPQIESIFKRVHNKKEDFEKYAILVSVMFIEPTPDLLSIKNIECQSSATH